MASIKQADLCAAATRAVGDGQAMAGRVHSIETCGTADGPGIRYILFLTGCPLHCLYCHNPDTWHSKDGKLMTVAEVLADIAKYVPFIKKRGGVTISGGEPTVQAKFCAEVFRGCKAMGLHTALDTSGFLGSKVSDEMLTDIELVLLDIKAARRSIYRNLTDVDLDPTITFADRLAAMGKPVWLRYVLVPGYNDQIQDIEELATFAATLGNLERVDVLPFHKMGEHKWSDRGMDYQLTKVEPPSAELVQTARQIFHDAGLYVA